MCKKIAIVLCLISLLLIGCPILQRGDVKISLVAKDQLAPHAGYNFGPESYLEEGDRVKMTGGLIWMKHTEPNDLYGE